ncbi:MAG: DUF3857 domain-containing protein [Marinirhabdus sp.]|nr:DUF3857 domain-containing protein [Marinirhabdus sp.]
MKNNSLILLMLLFATTLAVAQSKEELKLRAQFWDSKDDKKNTVEIPEKWAGESAVVLYKEEFFQYTNNGKKMYNPSFVHQRVKLLDKASVENYSEINYEKDERVGMGLVNFYRDETTVGVKIIKPDGREIILDIDKEKVTQDEQNRVAIPGLEVGDVLDIFIYQDDYQRSFGSYHKYEPVERVLSSKYPTVYSKLSVEVENDYFLNMESYNGAPKIREVATDRNATKMYVLEAEDLEKRDFPRWYYPLAELPAIKFQVIFSLRMNSYSKSSGFLGEDGERKSGVTRDEILEYYGRDFKASSRSTLRDVTQYVESTGVTDKRQQVIEALYFMRHNSYNRFIELVIAKNNDIAAYPAPCDTDYIILTEDNFVNYMSGLAKELDVDYDIVVATANYNGSIDDLLLQSNVSYGLRFNFPEPLYFFDLSPHVQAEFFPYYLEGTKVYTLAVKKNRKIEAVTTDMLPVSTSKENVSKEVLNVAFTEDFKKAEVNRELSFSGHFKREELLQRLSLKDFLNEEFKKYDTKHFYNCKKRQRKDDIELQRKMDAVMLTYEEQQKENSEERTAAAYDAKIEDYTYTVNDASRYSNAPFTISDSFIMDEELVKKAGPNFIVDVGRFVGGQVQIKEDEKERDLGVYLDFAKSFIYEVNITIPEGYEVAGIDKLNTEKMNATGGFKSTATISGNVLTYKTEKIYANKSGTAADWQQMIPWLDLAYDFSQSKVLFKKI